MTLRNVFAALVAALSSVGIAPKTDASRSEEVALDRPAVLAWCRQRGIGHVETSAKDGTGVDAAMEAIALLAVENKRRRPRPEPDPACEPAEGRRCRRRRAGPEV